MGLSTRWKGKFHVSNELDELGVPKFFGKKDWACPILLHEHTRGYTDRYLTSLHEALHEALHSVSAGMNEAAFRSCRGYEEGVVTACTSLLKNDLMDHLNLPRVAEYGRIAPGLCQNK